MSETYQCSNIMCGAFIDARDRVQISGLTYCANCAPAGSLESPRDAYERRMFLAAFRGPRGPL